MVAYSPALGSGSPKIDAGIPTTDLEGNSRPLPSSDDNVDMGAYEEYLEGVFPVELSSFSAIIKDQSVELHWKTATEVNNYGFEVERQMTNDLVTNDGDSQSSLVNSHWLLVGFVKGNGNSNSPKEYSFVDNNSLSGKVDYRLKQIDNNGEFQYSNTVEVSLSAPTEFSLEQNYPNPFNPGTTIKYSVANAGFVTMKLYNIVGEEVATLVNEEEPAGYYKVEFSAKGGSPPAEMLPILQAEFIFIL